MNDSSFTERQPFNINVLSQDVFKNLGEVTSPLIFSPSTDTFHENGLFSEQIFGEVTSPTRLSKFGFINLHTTVLHPKLYRSLIRLRRFYGEVLSGQSFATFDANSGEFIRASEDDTDSDTGYAFFMQHLPNLTFPDTDSADQRNRIKFVMDNKETGLIRRYLVLPAGIRDYKIDVNGRGSSEEINALYSALLRFASSLDERTGTDPMFDTVRFAMQRKVNEIYEYIENIFAGPSGGKRGFAQKKLGARNLALGARNVISAANFRGTTPEDPTFQSLNDTMLPLVLVLKTFQPVVTYWLRHYFFAAMISPDREQAAVIDPKTGNTTFQTLNDKERSLFATTDGIEKLIDLFVYPSFRDKPVIIHNIDGAEFYLQWVYEDGDTIYLTQGRDTFQSNYKEFRGKDPDLSKLRPITYVEMFYIAAYTAIHTSGTGREDKLVQICRYPAIELGSAYVSRVKVMTTTPSRAVKLGTLTPSLPSIEFPFYPVIGAEYVDSTVVHPAWLAGLGGDYDGDMVCDNGIMNGASIRQGNEYLDSAKALLQPNGELAFSINTDVLTLVMFNLSWSPDLQKTK